MGFNKYIYEGTNNVALNSRRAVAAVGGFFFNGMMVVAVWCGVANRHIG